MSHSAAVPDFQHPLHLPCDAGAGHARRLLATLGIATEEIADDREDHPHVVWARSGAMALTGASSPMLTRTPLASAARGAFLALAALNPRIRESFPRNFFPETLLSERAAIAGLTRQGNRSCGGSCELIPTLDGVVALNLARDDDWEQLPALLSDQPPAATLRAGDWVGLRDNLRRQRTERLLELGQALGLAIADAVHSPAPRPWVQRHAPCDAPVPQHKPLVIDLSALWAGPLCSSLLAAAGGRVIKVESRQRPDGARHGPRAFFDLMNQGKESLALDLTSAQGQRQLAALIEQADIVIESSRPRALRHMGIDAETIVRRQPGKLWISLTGYGRGHELRIAYGDDAGVAAGLSQLLFEDSGHYRFCGDAIADPLAGLHAAVAACAHWHSGRGGLLDISLVDVTRFCSEPLAPANAAVEFSGNAWWLQLGQDRVRVAEPQSRMARGPAAELGADNHRLFQEFALPC